MTDLLFITTQLGESYAAWKEEEKAKEEDRKSFFTLAVEELQRRAEAGELELRTKVVEVWAMDIPDAEEIAQRRHPRFNVEGVQHIRTDEDTGYEYFKAVLKENPEFVTFTFVNPHDGKTYQRRVDDGKLSIDEFLLEEEQPDLYESLSRETWGGHRVLCPLDLMTPAMQQSVAEYIFPGPPKIVLAPPRDTKPEDLT